MAVKINTVRELGAVLHARRKELHLSQTSVAEAAHVTRQWLAELEKGKATVQIGRSLRVIDALGFDLSLERPPTPDPAGSPGGVDLDRLLGGMGEP